MTDERLEALFVCYHRLVMDAAYQVVRDYYLAQDICQDVFIRLTPKEMDIADNPDEMRKFLIAVTNHRAIDYIRKRGRRKETRLTDGDAQSDVYFIESIDNQIDQRAFASKMFLELRRKKPDWYEVIRRVGYYDQSVKEIAQELEVSQAVVRSRLSRAKKWIVKNYGDNYSAL